MLIDKIGLKTRIDSPDDRQIDYTLATTLFLVFWCMID